jgi:hypothetical protein
MVPLRLLKHRIAAADMGGRRPPTILVYASTPC